MKKGSPQTGRVEVTSFRGFIYPPVPLVQDSGQHAFGANAIASAKTMTELTAKRGAVAPRVSPAHDQNAINIKKIKVYKIDAIKRQQFLPDYAENPIALYQ